MKILTTALGGVFGAAWWYGFHKKQVTKRDAWYAEYEKTKAAENAE